MDADESMEQIQTLLRRYYHYNNEHFATVAIEKIAQIVTEWDES